jgi:hypothetical protein
MAPLRPATTADAGILAVHHHHALRASGSSDAEATALTGTFLPWARSELEAGRLIALIAGDGLNAEGSAALHLADRPEPFSGARLLYCHAVSGDALERTLVGALLAEARLRGVTCLEATPSEVAGLGLEAGTRQEWRL